MFMKYRRAMLRGNRFRPGHDRGSVLVFVVVVLVLMIMLGTVALQMARNTRFALADIQPSNNIDTVRSAVINEIGTILVDDLANDKGEFYNAGLERSGDEPFDFPWTNNSRSECNEWPIQLHVTTSEPEIAFGGHRDDTWLASSTPEFSLETGNPVWQHISNLKGVYLLLPTVGLDGDRALPWECRIFNNVPALAKDVFGRDTDVELSTSTDYTMFSGWPDWNFDEGTWGPSSADADGDGIADSRWTWASIPQIGDVRYVMAVRIIDLSAMLNVNVALSLADDQGDYVDDDEVARWWYPSELDLNSFEYSFAEMVDEVQWVNQYRNVPHLPGRLVNGFVEREDYWYDGPSGAFPILDDEDYQRRFYDPADHEVELRFRNGLNNAANATIFESGDSGMANLTRQAWADSDDSESHYEDFNCAHADCGAPGSTAMGDYFAYNPRLYLTSISGTSHHMPVTRECGATCSHAGHEERAEEAGGLLEVWNLLEVWKLWEESSPGVPAEVALDMRAMLAKLLLEWDMPFGNPTPGLELDPDPEPSQRGIVPYGDRFDAAYQLVANLIDYYDDGRDPEPDSRITGVVYTHPTDGEKVRYGMESLPFLSEVYIQGAYWLSAAQETNAGAPEGTEEYDFTWELEGDIGYAIELTNPFASPVRNLQHVRLVVNGTVWGASLYDLIGSPADRSMEARTGIVFYRDAGGDDGLVLDPDDNKISPPGTGSPSGFDSVPAGWIEVALPETMPFDQDLVVELQVLVDPDAGTPGTEWITYSRVQRSLGDVDVAGGDTILADDSDRLFLPETVTHTGAVVGVPSVAFTFGSADHQRWVQRSARCNTDGLNVIGVVSTATGNEMAGAGTGAADGSFTPPEADAGTGMETLGPEFPLLDLGLVGESDKGAGLAPAWDGDGAMDVLDFAARSYGFDDVAFRFVTDVTRVMWVGPTKTKTFAEVFAEAQLEDDVTGDPYRIDDKQDRDDRLRMRMLNLYVDVDWPADPNWAADEINATDDVTSDARLPRAALLLDRITAVPVDRDRVTRIEGRLNLNTVSEKVLQTALPLPGGPGTLKKRLIDAIVDLRDGKGLNGAGDGHGRWRWQRTGIASIGELLQLDLIDPDASLAKVETGDQFNAKSDGLQIAFDGGGNPVAVTDAPPENDRTEEVRLAGFLANVASVRSDTYCAYVKIRGYPAGDFRDGPVEATQFMVIYDRSGVTESCQGARVVGVYKLR